MGLMHHIVRGFGLGLGLEAAKRTIRAVEKNADTWVEQEERRLQDQKAAREAEREQARRLQTEAVAKREAMQKKAKSELRRMKQQLGLLPPDPWWVRFLRTVRLYRD